MFVILFFIGVAAAVEEEIMERLIEKLTFQVRSGVGILLFVSLVISILLLIKNRFQFYDWGNIGKMWIGIGILASFGVFMWKTSDQMKILLLPILLLVVVVLVISLLKHEK